MRVVATANITLSGLQTIDSVALAEGDRVLVTAQTSGVQNGIYEASAGTWARAEDMRLSRHVQLGTTVLVLGGTVYALTTWVLTSPSTGTVRLGSDSLTFTRSGNAVLVGGNAIISSASGGYVGLQEGTTEVLRVSDAAGVSTIQGRGSSGTQLVANAGYVRVAASDAVVIDGSEIDIRDAGSSIFNLTMGGSNDSTFTVPAARSGAGFVATTASQYIYFRVGSGGGVYFDSDTTTFRDRTAATTFATISQQGVIVLPSVAAAGVTSPAAGSFALFFDSSNSDKLSKKSSGGTVTVIGTEA
ncbi:MAG: hypothetical protein IPG04_17360 [Polyangiaceae bacterium]|nr:hypothetical protein [Polyangiaceae bacterium]